MRFLLTIGLLLVALRSFAFDPAQQDDSMGLLRQFQTPSNPVDSETQQGRVVPVKGDTVCLMGGAEIFRLQDSTEFDASLHAAFPDLELRVRNAAWPADTVYRQQRPMYFFTEKGFEGKGSVPDGRERIEPGTMILCFGRMESFDGPERIVGFSSAYGQLVDALRKRSSRIVLVEPIPFSDETRNGNLGLYADAVKKIAEARGLRFVELGDFSRDCYGERGWQLSPEGQALVARKIVAGIGGETRSLTSEASEWIEKKNRLWDQYYRPTNWAFLYGDRQSQPSSRDHRDPNRRWFEEELNKIPPMLRETEEKIWALAKEGTK